MEFKITFYEIAGHFIDFQLYFLSIFFFYLKMIYYTPKTLRRRKKFQEKRWI